MGLQRAGAARLRAWETNPFAIEKPKTRTEGESSQPEALRRLPGRLRINRWWRRPSASTP